MNENLNILVTMLHTWTDDEVYEAWQLIADEGKRRKDRKTKAAKATLKIGDKVRYRTKIGTSTGKIVKVKTKNATVVSNGKMWNVPMNILEKV